MFLAQTDTALALPGLLVPTNPTEFWTMVVAIATVVLVFVAGLGLNSIRLAKRDMRTTAERDVTARTMERLREYAKEIIPANKAIWDAMEKHQIPVFVQDLGKVDFDAENEAEFERARKWVALLPDDLRQQVLELLNDMEAWAAYFVNRVADGEVAFGPIAPPYCGLVVQYYGLLILLRKHRGSGSYPNLIKLFESWREKLVAAETDKAMGGLLEQLEDLRARKVLKHELERPIGMED